MSHENKIKIVETLWKIIYSNQKADIYESNLMRRLSGLLYLDAKVVGDIKEKVLDKVIEKTGLSKIFKDALRTWINRITLL